MATEAVSRIDAYSVAQATESQNQEKERRRESARDRAKPKGAAPSEAPVSPDSAAASASQIVDSSTVVQLLSHSAPSARRARFLAPVAGSRDENRRKTDAKKLDRSA